MNDQPISNRASATFLSMPLTEKGIQIQIALRNAAAVLWDVIDNISVEPGNSHSGRLVSLAKTELESSVMWAAKAVSRQE